ncbi:MAG TPA: hypothetical protein VES65_10535, partial [Solirubrobacteraceae bacterium]|nr:hypothetical protein [Solirubrobacteraceae bacterium]
MLEREADKERVVLIKSMIGEVAEVDVVAPMQRVPAKVRTAKVGLPCVVVAPLKNDVVSLALHRFQKTVGVFDCMGQRFLMAGLPRWRKVAYPLHAHANEDGQLPASRPMQHAAPDLLAS